MRWCRGPGQDQVGRGTRGSEGRSSVSRMVNRVGTNARVAGRVGWRRGWG